MWPLFCNYEDLLTFCMWCKVFSLKIMLKKNKMSRGCWETGILLFATVALDLHWLFLNSYLNTCLSIWKENLKIITMQLIITFTYNFNICSMNTMILQATGKYAVNIWREFWEWWTYVNLKWKRYFKLFFREASIT